ncbi:MAG: sugar phosphate isomerase/epimerase family protein [Bryobacteraceae bacterium]
MNLHSRRELLAGSALAAIARQLRAIPLSEIKLGITTDEIDQDLQAAAAFVAEHGLKWAEIRNVWGEYNTEQPIEKIRQGRGILDQYGVKVSIEDAGLFKMPLPPEGPQGRKTMEEQWALLERSKERARAFGTDKIRIFAFTMGGQAPSEKSYGRIYELIREAARRAKGFRLAIETIGDGYVWTGAEAAELLKNVKEDNVGITWDPNNAAQAPSSEPSFPNGYRRLDPARIFHVHLRDYTHQDHKVVWAAVGQGEFDNLGQIRALLKDGYKGTFTLETHWRDPKTKGDPRNARYSTEISLAALLKVIDKV